ncbi:MAG TPA: hypothetical protein VGZ47_12480 [Gemmataceae bacterium]|jgi:hypothetical protein|nr:hypothetical protein [Gemmataceae bacterium]
MRRLLWLLAASLLLAPLAWADDKKDPPPKDSPPAKEPATPKEKYDALLKDFNKQQRELMAELQKAKGEDQQKMIQKYFGMGKDYADKFYKIYEEDPKSPVASDALFWVVQNGAGSSSFDKAMDKVTTVVKEMPLDNLMARLQTIGGNPKLFEAVLERAAKEEKSPQAPKLLGWVAMRGSFLPVGQKAIERLVEKYPESPAVGQAFQALGRAPKGEDTLKGYLEKGTNDGIKAWAALTLGRMYRAKSDRVPEDSPEGKKLAADAENYLVMVVDKFGKENAEQKKEAERELNIIRHLRVGKEALDIVGPDLDDKSFKLSDYRGKVVLLDFWGNW